ncbi:unnamed protein product [Aphanomyces euteiches]
MFVPLSSGEEHFLRQEETKRRRKQRLIEVRLQEKRIAQERAKWYHQRLQESREKKRTQKVNLVEDKKSMMLSTLHSKYKASLAAIGDAHRRAQDFQVALHARAKKQLELLANNDDVEESRFNHAIYDERQEFLQRNERERVVRENLVKIQEIAQRQRAHAEKVQRFKTSREVHEKNPREEMARSMEEKREHVIVFPKGTSLHTTRLHARGDNKILRHNMKHKAAVDGWEEGIKKRLEVDQAAQTRFYEQERQKTKAFQRGESAERVIEPEDEARSDK